MHQTFSKGSLNLRKQKLILFFTALYLLELISPNQSQEYAVDAACLTPWGRQLLPRDPHSNPDSPLSTLHLHGDPTSKLKTKRQADYKQQL